ncbi:MAG: hypothetical protein NTZ10_04930 [Candidatus Saganbacteria bacterium]|nr:hypothetical protein [Candidatus Saganbacteria bacterium]
MARRVLYGRPAVRPSQEAVNNAILEEEEGYSGLDPRKLDLIETNRRPIMGALRAVELPTFHEFIPLNADCVVEIGAASNFLYRNVLDEPLKRIWNPFEINLEIIRTNNLFAQPGMILRSGSAYRPLSSVKDGTADAWVGHSSYDSIGFLEIALRNAVRYLKPGGVFIHIQDVVPASFPSQRYVQYSLGEMDVKLLSMECFCGNSIFPTKDGINPLDPYIDLNERLIEAMKKNGLNIVKDSLGIGVWVGPREDRHDSDKRDLEKNYFLWNKGKLFCAETLISEDDNPPLKAFLCALKKNSSITLIEDKKISWSSFLALMRGRKRSTVRLEPHSYSVDMDHPVIIYPASLLKQAGFVQEIFMADIVVGTK